MNDNMDIYLNMFLEETREQMEQMEQDLLILETCEFDHETINGIFRMAHSIKGAAATMEFNTMSKLSHGLENLLDKIRSGEINIDSDIIDICLKSVDILKGIHQSISEGNNDDVNIDIILNEIQSIINSKLQQNDGDICKVNLNLDTNKEVVKVGIREQDLELSGYEKNICENVNKNLDVYKIIVKLDNQTKMISVKSFLIINNLMGIGDIIYTEPNDYEDIPDDKFGTIFKIILATDRNEESIYKNINSISEIENIYINKVISGHKKNSIPENVKITSSTDTKKHEEVTTIRVDISKIDKLLNMVGEFIIDKENLNGIAMELKRKYKNDSTVGKLIELIPHISYISSELQETVMSTRMLPLENIFNRFPRMVRDLAKKCKKEIEFVIEGKETEIDRGIIEELVDPLTHIIRNSIDHGIESVEERLLGGKPEIAVVRLSARHEENSVVLEVEDDGRGIDVEKIKSKIIEKELASENELQNMSKEQILNFIFDPGFSTADKITDISGRGVGLDVVRSNISKINGIIDIKTDVNIGTKFIIKLPLTLAIVHALLIKEEEYTFALPISSIIEILRLRDVDIKEKIHVAGDIEIFDWREQTIPIIRIGKYFDINNSKSLDKLYVVVVGCGEKKAALVVQKLLGEQEIVIKSMGDYIGKDKLLGEVKGISGVSILGDGSFTQIIEIATLVKR